MARKPRRAGPPSSPRFVKPPYVPNVRRPGDEGSAFRRAVPAEPKAERQFLALLGTNAGLAVMCCLLAAVVIIVLILVVTRA
jgi:hypothetical protein